MEFNYFNSGISLPKEKKTQEFKFYQKIAQKFQVELHSGAHILKIRVAQNECSHYK